MDYQDSLKLFSLNAFKQNHPRETYMDLSEKVLNYAKGIPLALKVLGSLLYRRTREAWESELQKLEKLPNLEIFNLLKLSYDGLDDKQKNVFLDIACFYRGHEENVVAQTLDTCGFYANIVMNVLKDRCLISILEGRIAMHDLIQEMGLEIVHQQCVSNPGKRSRLWKLEEIYHVLSKNQGTDAIECILLDMCKIKKVQLHAETFKKMHSLRMLQFYKSSGYWNESNVFLQSFLKGLPDGLKILRWDGFPQRSLPLKFCPKNLVRLEMSHCHLEQLWKRDQHPHLPKLKRLDLSYSRKLNQIPDLCLTPNIEEIILSDCVSLIKVYSSCFLSKLNCLCLNGCVELRTLYVPSNILLRSSGLILLSNCRMLETFSISNSQFPHSYPTLLSARAIGFNSEEAANNIDLPYVEMLREGVSSIFPSPNKLCWLDLSNCESLTCLPLDLSEFKFLKRLNLGGCSNFENFPEIGDTMENLTVLILDRTAIRELPSSLCCLVGLEELSLHRCTSLEIISFSIGSLYKLCNLDLTYCESLQTFPSSIFELKLTKLDLHGCLMLRTFPEILKPTKSFAHISLTKTAIKALPSSFDNLVGLQTLRLNMCSDLESLPNSIVNLNLLSELDCSGCGKLTEIPSDIGRLSLLRELSLHVSGIVNLPESIAHLSSLKSLDLSDCKKLECIPQLPSSLKQLLAFDCPSITRVMPNSRIQIPSDSTEDIFKFHLTNSRQLDPSARVNIVGDAWHRITDDAYRSVFFCFPGSAVPHWFPFRGKGHSVTINTDSLSLCNENRLVGFALCVVFGLLDMDDTKNRHGFFSYRLKFESDDGIYILPDHDELRNHFYWKGRERIVDQDHTFLWKYNLESISMSLMLSHAHSFTFEISQYDYGFRRRPYFKSIVTIKECGICPLYTK